MSSASYNNVFFVAVGRVPNGSRSIIVASYAHNTSTDVAAVKQVLDQPNMQVSPGKHYSFQSGTFGWHLIGDDSGLIYILIADVKYPQRTAHMCLEELQRNFAASFADKALTARDNDLNRGSMTMLQTICQKYDNLAAVDKLSAVARKVDSVKLVMQDNVEIALRNCVKLEKIEQAAEELQQQAGVFKRQANELKKKMWWKNSKMKLIIGGIILVILGIIIAIAVVMSKK